MKLYRNVQHAIYRLQCANIQSTSCMEVCPIRILPFSRMRPKVATHTATHTG